MTDTSGPVRPSSEAIESRLAALTAEIAAERGPSPVTSVPAKPQVVPRARRRHPLLRWLVWFPLKVLVALILPFAMLIGGAVWLYRVQAMPTWVALSGGMVITAVLVTYYVVRMSKAMTGRASWRFVGTKIALPLIGAYCVYGLLFLSSANAKTEEVRGYYRTVHPLLRLALSTAVLADREIVVTDTRREPADYDRMGLPRLENSLHFPQTSGYVHAVDLRTVGRADWKNALVAGYFRVLGFRTLRHVGTADHLHVSLAPPGDNRL